MDVASGRTECAIQYASGLMASHDSVPTAWDAGGLAGESADCWAGRGASDVAGATHGTNVWTSYVAGTAGIRAGE